MPVYSLFFVKSGMKLKEATQWVDALRPRVLLWPSFTWHQSCDQRGPQFPLLYGRASKHGETHTTRGPSLTKAIQGLYLRHSPAKLLELLQGPGRVQSPTGPWPHVACEHGLPSVQQGTGLSR